MSIRYRVIADHPSYTDMGVTRCPDIHKGDIVTSPDFNDAANGLDSDGDVYVRNQDDKSSYIAFDQLEKITDTAPAAAAPDPSDGIARDVYSGAQLLDAAERLGLVDELTKIARLVGMFREVEAVVAEMREAR